MDVLGEDYELIVADLRMEPVDPNIKKRAHNNKWAKSFVLVTIAFWRLNSRNLRTRFQPPFFHSPSMLKLLD